MFIGRANCQGLTVSRNYALGDIIANSTRTNIGAFTGSALIDTVFLDNYVNLETYTLSDRKIGNLQTDGVTDLSKAQLTVQTSFRNWDFNEIWQIREDSNAPTLRK